MKTSFRAAQRCFLSQSCCRNSYGFDVDFAPVADVNTTPENIIIGPRAFSDEPETAGKMVQMYLKALQKQGVSGCLKHYPGHGDTKADTHLGYAVSHRTREELPPLRRCDSGGR
ncbi:MAG: glycoside hydrolase family 3 protein [Bacteroidales bacterium]|nr:glycoside hydrolase family 3 protein [Bacteroidales bacterium]